MSAHRSASERPGTTAPPAVRARFRTSPGVSSSELNRLYAHAWPRHRSFDFSPVLKRSLGWVSAYERERLIGFVYLAWDGAQHAFLLEPTVHPDFRHQGLGTALVRRAVRLAQEHGCEWVHVDWEARLTPFYRACGFGPTHAGLIHLGRPKATPRSALDDAI